MGTFSIAEQTIDLGKLSEDPITVTSIAFRTDPNASHLVDMELSIEPSGEVTGYRLQFNRNGDFVSVAEVKPEPAPEPAEDD